MKELYSVLIFLFLYSWKTKVIEANCPSILSKREWSSRINNQAEKISTPIEYVIIAHTSSSECNTVDHCSNKLKNLEAYYMEHFDYKDISFNFLIGGNGNVFEGVGWHKEGQHTPFWDNRAIGIAFIGNFAEKLPSSLALQGLRNLLVCGVETGELALRYKIITQRQVKATQSPGARLFIEISSWPHFVANIED